MHKKKAGWGSAYSEHRVLSGRKTVFHGKKGDCLEFVRRSNVGGLRVVPPNCK